jgi:curved DNA-binding protein CbpA
LEDYYAVLGLDHEASPESIKLAYRRLARENHPDRNVDSTEAEKRMLSARMAELNGAYAVLSDAALRREYDDKLRILITLTGSTVLRSTKTATKTAAKPNSSHRAPPPHDAELTLVREFSKQLRCNLQSHRKEFSWEEIALEGFDWGLESVSWSSHYCVAARAFTVLDPAAAKKFANYSQVVVTRGNRPIRKSHFLFLMPFQQMIQSESVSAEFNRLISTENRETRLAVPIGIVLFDARRGRTLRVGGKLQEKRFEELVQSLGTVLVNS